MFFLYLLQKEKVSLMGHVMHYTLYIQSSNFIHEGISLLFHRGILLLLLFMLCCYTLNYVIA